MVLNSIFVKYSYISGVLVVDEFFVFESEWHRLIALLSDPFNVIPETGMPLTIEDFIGHLLPNKIRPTHYSIPAGKEILASKWGGVYVVPETVYLSEWSATRYKIEYAGDNLYAFGNRRLVYRTTVIYDEDDAETWRGSRDVTEVRFTPQVTSWQYNEPQNIFVQVYIKTIYTGSSGGCVPGDSSISIDIPATPFHQACDGSPAINWDNYELLNDVYHYECDTVIKNAGDVLCNAEDFGITLTYFSGFNSYSSWSGYDFGSGQPGMRYNGIVFNKPVEGGGIVPKVITAMGGLLTTLTALNVGIRLYTED